MLQHLFACTQYMTEVTVINIKYIHIHIHYIDLIYICLFLILSKNFSFSLIVYPIGSAKNNGEETLSALNIKYVEQACNLFI